MNYSKKLLDPRWQKKRLEVFNRDNFTCTVCTDIENTLHVHHETYNGDPWDVELDSLKTVCVDCHSLLEHCKKAKIELKNFIGIAPSWRKSSGHIICPFEKDGNILGVNIINYGKSPFFTNNIYSTDAVNAMKKIIDEASK